MAHGSRRARIAARTAGLRRARSATRFSAAGAVALTVLFGVGFARSAADASAATSQGGDAVRGDLPNGDSGGLFGDDRSTGTGQGGTLQPPGQAPGLFGGGGHVRSGGS